ncbi:Annexin A6 [Trichoplax sp. H2]|uniref:Annexin n=1 Tax=Trichoplax adhaerens TaxID=10228 RepID=B3RPM7_TRIAD|nr:hypothetical protein TRIADDRAFT_53595 [Trichoplax adhaerens]EDV27661.1 hypothetical protein TRIADDRAFT_53595 [Trichoplax adhaerens]RDD45300.1 Annexin A6 [Trichoplax sp. H2]|eukprot:XP_002109495.1 hypothetical protein TRIADDRAFT_53595 [Trichoplax adhaerens]
MESAKYPAKDFEGFDPESDCERLHRAMDGLGTDEDTLTGILSARSNSQRQVLRETYLKMFAKDLIEHLSSETSGSFRKLLCGLMIESASYDAKLLHDAMDGPGTDESLLLEVLCTRSNSEIQALKIAYKQEYGVQLSDAIIEETSGHFKQLLLLLIKATRDETDNVSISMARRDADSLYIAGELTWGTDESTFTEIIGTRNFRQLRLIFDEYIKTAQMKIEKSLQREMSGDLLQGLLTLVQVARDRGEYFAEKIKAATGVLANNDDELIRIAVSQAEVDTGRIAAAFERKFGVTLINHLSKALSGEYKNLMLAVLSGS